MLFSAAQMASPLLESFIFVMAIPPHTLAIRKIQTVKTIQTHINPSISMYFLTKELYDQRLKHYTPPRNSLIHPHWSRSNALDTPWRYVLALKLFHLRKVAPGDALGTKIPLRPGRKPRFMA